MEELATYLRQKSGDVRPEDTPVEGDISEMGDLGVRIEQVN
ncbi:MAG TPA: hypothetical protein VJ742_10615 [Nitrososphaera sp.]|nr:hypothetical protein [Nitrososphaera sp.]